MATKTKTCTKCKEEKPFEAFYKNTNYKDGHRSQCKNCQKQQRSNWCKQNRERSNTYQTNWRKNNPEKVKEIQRKNCIYLRQNQPEKVRARKLIHKKISRGQMDKKPCVICGKIKTEAHHCNYSKPLDVMWLCKEHHDGWHRAFSAG
jgi:hypothetical protein